MWCPVTGGGTLVRSISPARIRSVTAALLSLVLLVVCAVVAADPAAAAELAPIAVQDLSSLSLASAGPALDTKALESANALNVAVAAVTAPASPAGTELVSGGAPLNGAHLATGTSTIEIYDSSSISGAVTWTVDGASSGTTTASPHRLSLPFAIGSHSVKAQWGTGSTAKSSSASFTAGPWLSYGSASNLSGSKNVAAPFQVTLANDSGVTGEVTWLLDDAFLVKTSAAPHQATVAVGLGQHKLKARWVISGSTTAEVVGQFVVQTDLTWTPPKKVVEEPSPALANLWLSSDNRRAPKDGLYDWSKAGFGGGASLPGDSNVRGESACNITADTMRNQFGVRGDDGSDDTNGIQSAIDQVKNQCSSSGSFTAMSRIILPSGTLNISREIHVDADYLLIRGQGSDPSTGTNLVYRPDANTRYDTISADGTRWDTDAMTSGTANGGWIWPGRGMFRVQTRQVASQYVSAYAAAPANRKDLYEGTINDHWTTGLTLRGKPGDANFAARKGDTVVYLDSAASFNNLKVGGLVNVMAANTTKMYADMQVFPTTEALDALYMRQQIFMVTSGDPDNRTITLDKPLEYDVPVTSTSDGSTAINGTVTSSKVSPLVDAVVGVGFENFRMTQAEDGLDPTMARDNYGNMDPAGAMHGVVFKWAANSWVKGIRAEMVGSHPIVTEDAANLSIVDNYFDGSWNKGKGGNGYLRGSRVWDSLYAGNTLRGLRHFAFQWSASGNVVVGNSMDNDINLHGGYERNNLFELNEVVVPYAHRSGSCWTNCGGEGGESSDTSQWFPIWWAAGKKAVKWSGATGPNNVFFNNHLRKQVDNDTTKYQNFSRYTQVGRIYQFGVDSSGAFHHLDENGSPIADWSGKEDVDFANGHGVNAARTDSQRSLFLNELTLDGYAGPHPQELRRTWGCSCWDGRGMVNTRLAADPVNTATGSLMENFTDLSIAGVGAALSMERTYNSSDTSVGAFGQGWSYSYGAYLEARADGAFYFHEPTGGVTKFVRDATSGAYSSPDTGVTASLRDESAGWVLVSQSGQKMTFNASGKVIGIADDRSRGVSLAYNSNNQLTTVTDTLGQKFTFTWSSSSTPSSMRVLKVTGSNGQSVSYGYTSGRLTSVTGIDANVTRFTYDAGGRLNGIKDPLGNTTAQTVYDATSGRVISQKDATGAETKFAWDSATETATITNPDGSITKDVYRGNVLVSRIGSDQRSADVYYDANNHPALETNEAQQRTLTTFDGAGNMLSRTRPASVVDPVARTESWTYDNQNRELSHTNFLGGRSETTYDAAGNVASRTDENGAVQKWTYNARGQALTHTDALGNVTSMTYGTTGNLLKITDALGNSTTYSYDASHNKIAETDPRGNVSGATAATKEAFTKHWTYDAYGRVLTETDAADNVTSRTYDALGHLLTETKPDGGVTKYSYDSEGRVLTTTDPAGNVSTNVYDGAGNRTAMIAPDGARTTWTYDDLGQMISSIDPIGSAAGASDAVKAAHTTEYSYDSAGNPTITRIPDPSAPGSYIATVTTYDQDGEPVAVTDPSSGVSTTDYDALGRKVKTVDPTGVENTFAYDPAGRVITSFENGVSKTFAYDLAGQMTAMAVGSNSATTYTYDAAGRKASETAPLGNVAGANATSYRTLVSYDRVGNVISTTGPLNRTISQSFDASNHLVKVTDASGQVTTYEYDVMGRVSKVTDATGAITQFAFNATGQLATKTTPNGGAYKYTYDNTGRITELLTPLGKKTTYAYDLAGALTSTVVPRGSIAYTYDAAGRRTGENYSDATPDSTMTFDKSGHPLTVVSGGATTRYAYDLAGRTTSIARPNGKFDYSYDQFGRLQKRTLPDGRTQSLNWNAQGVISSSDTVASSTQNTVSYTWDANGNVTAATRSNGPSTSYLYDAADELVSMQTKNGATTVAAQTISWDRTARPMAVTTTIGSTSKSAIYGYDSLGRLTSSCTPTSGTTCLSSSPTTAFTYDLQGNRTSVVDSVTGTATSTYDADDRLASTADGAGTTSFTYTDDGALSSVVGPSGTTTYAYGLDGNLYNAVLPSGKQLSFAYDDLGDRIEAKVNGVSNSKWTWDTLGRIATRVNESGAATHRWFADPISASGSALSDVSSAGEATWLINDYQGSIIASTKTGASTGTARYDSYGNTTSATGAMSTQPLRYVGQYFDSTLGLYDLRARDYSAVMGRFLQVDPQPPADGQMHMSTYSYAYNQPTYEDDPTGRCPDGLAAMKCSKNVLGAAVRAAAAAPPSIGVIQSLMGGSSSYASAGSSGGGRSYDRTSRRESPPQISSSAWLSKNTPGALPESSREAVKCSSAESGSSNSAGDYRGPTWDKISSNWDRTWSNFFDNEESRSWAEGGDWLSKNGSAGLAVNGCAIQCVQFGAGTSGWTFGYGVGPDIGVSGQAGVQFGSNSGWSVTGECTVAAGPVGVSFEGGVGQGPTFPVGGGVAYSAGAEAGCAGWLKYEGNWPWSG